MMSPQPRPEIEWGEPTPKRSWESEEARRVRQAKNARGMEFQAAKRRAARIRWAIKAPLALALLGGATLVGLDYSNKYPVGIFDHTPPIPVLSDATPPPSPRYDATLSALVRAAVGESRAATSLPLAPQDELPPASLTLAPGPMAPADAQKLRDRLAHAESGIAVISRERNERLAMLATEDRLLRGSIVNGRRTPDSLYDQNRVNAQNAIALQSAARAHQSGADFAYSNQLILIENVQAQIQNTITNETHDADVLRSLSARLAQAQHEASDIRAQLPP